MKGVIRKLYTFLASFAILAGVMPFEANSQQFHSTFKKWEVYSTKENGETVCFITSYPVKKSGNYKRRSEPYALVTYRSGGQTEVSFYVGYPFRKGYESDVSVDGKHNYKFFTTEKTPGMAWAKDKNMDISAITKMKNGGNVTAKGTSRKGTYSLDKYSLSGFTSAYNKIKQICK